MRITEKNHTTGEKDVINVTLNSWALWSPASNKYSLTSCKPALFLQEAFFFSYSLLSCLFFITFNIPQPLYSGDFAS